MMFADVPQEECCHVQKTAHLPVIPVLLSPYDESAVEIETILKDPRLRSSLKRNEAITRIEKTKTGYKVFTANCTVRVEVFYKKDEWFGPAVFDLKFYTEK